MDPTFPPFPIIFLPIQKSTKCCVHTQVREGSEFHSYKVSFAKLHENLSNLSANQTGSLTNFQIHHFETVQNLKKMETTNEMWLLKDWGKRWNCSFWAILPFFNMFS